MKDALITGSQLLLKGYSCIRLWQFCQMVVHVRENVQKRYYEEARRYSCNIHSNIHYSCMPYQTRHCVIVPGPFFENGVRKYLKPGSRWCEDVFVVLMQPQGLLCHRMLLLHLSWAQHKKFRLFLILLLMHLHNNNLRLMKFPLLNDLVEVKNCYLVFYNVHKYNSIFEHAWLL